MSYFHYSARGETSRDEQREHQIYVNGLPNSIFFTEILFELHKQEKCQRLINSFLKLHFCIFIQLNGFFLNCGNKAAPSMKYFGKSFSPVLSYCKLWKIEK